MDVHAYQFTNNWFEETSRAVWDSLIPQIKPKRILEIGCYEGASTCYLINKLGSEQDLEIHCIDSWEGGIEHLPGGNAPSDMGAVERRFQHNLAIARQQAKYQVDVTTLKDFSDHALAALLAGGKASYFDFVYVDGSHQAPDVLLDAILSFKLLKIDGVIAFDDYLWQENLPYGTDPIRCPKPAIDAFTNIFCRKIRIIRAPLYQLFVQKIAE